MSADRMSAARRALGEIFGFERFRPGQEAVIEALLSGRDALTVMPTGSGKSLCFQVPALVMKGLRRNRFLGVTAGIVAHRDHPLHDGRVRPGDLAGWPWIDLDGPAPGGGRPSLAAVLDELRARTGRHVRAVVRAGSAGLLLLADGPWLAWLPLELLDRLPGPPLKALPLTFGRQRYRTGFIARRSAEDLAAFRRLQTAVHDAARHSRGRTRG